MRMLEKLSLRLLGKQGCGAMADMLPSGQPHSKTSMRINQRTNCRALANSLKEAKWL